MLKNKKPPTFQDRVSAAWGILTRRNPPPSQAKLIPYSWPTVTDGQPQYQLYDFETYVRDGFNSNAIINAAIQYKIKSVSLAPLTAYTGDLDKPEKLPPANTLAMLVKRPNPYVTMRQLMGHLIACLNIAGNAYVFLNRPSKDAPPTEMYALRPDRVRVIPKMGGVAGYLYIPEGKSAEDGYKIPPEYMIHVKFANPGDVLEGFGEGLSPISPMALSADVDNRVTKFLDYLFKTGTMAFGMLKFEMPLDINTINRIRTEWDEMYGGSDHWGRPLVLDSGGSYERGVPDFDKLGFDQIDQRNETRILGPLGVPAILIGARVGLENATYSNARELDKMFWQLTMTYELALFEDAFGYALNDGKNFVLFDTSKVPALQKDLKELIAATAQLTSIGVPLNIATKKTGLDLEDIEGGDVGYLPMNLIPAMGDIPDKVRTPLSPPEPPPPQLNPNNTDPNIPPPDPGQGGGTGQQNEPPQPGKRINRAKLIGRITGKYTTQWDDSRALKVWQQQDIIAKSWEANYQQAALEAFAADKSEILSYVTKEKGRAKAAKASMLWANVEDDALAYLKSKSVENWRSLFLPLMSGLVEDAGNYWAVELGMAFDVRNLLALQWFDTYTMKFAEDISATSQAQLSEALQLAQYQGWTVEQGVKNLDSLFAQWMNGNLSPDEFAWLSARMPGFRKEFIVLTETIRSYNAGSNALFKSWGIKKKQWWATMDERVCPFCNQMHGKIIGIDATFADLGETLEFTSEDGVTETLSLDYEDVGHPPLHVLCRCTELPVF